MHVVMKTLQNTQIFDQTDFCRTIVTQI